METSCLEATEEEEEKERVVLLLDLDCFYAQCERIRLGFIDDEDCSIALLQWDSVLAVSYPARNKYGIKRGDSWQTVRTKSAGQCLAVHVPVLEASSSASSGDHNHNNTRLAAAEVGETYESIYQRTPEEQLRLRERDVGRRRYSSEGKACLERYRVASRRIFQVVMKCLGIETTGVNSSSSNGTILLEKASIDEFFLDVTGVCQDPDHPLWKLIADTEQQQRQQGSTTRPPFSLDNHKTVVVGYDLSTSSESEIRMHQSTTTPNPLAAKNYPALERGCQLAHWIRYSVQQQLGFTLSAGISINKMMAKLGASYGKPNGQACILPCQIPSVLQTTKLSKVRNFGGKLGQAVQALLPPNIGEPTLGAVAQYLSLTQLQAPLGLTTAQFVWNAARGYDAEPVQAKNNGNLVKSITAFKSLPRALDADIEDPACLSWVSLLVQEVVSRVETDAQSHQRYPRNCTIHYGLFGQVNNRSGKLDMKSFRLPFPPRRLSPQDRVAQLMKSIPQKIVQRESNNNNNGGTTTHNSNNNHHAHANTNNKNRKRLRLVRIGVCATELEEMGGGSQQESIASFFAAASSGTSNITSSSRTTIPPKNEKPSNGGRPKLDLPYQEKTVASSKKEEEEEEDLKLARQLQANYDRENRVLGALDARHGISAHGRPAKKAKTKKISAFFTSSSKP